MQKLTNREQIAKSLSNFLLSNEIEKNASLIDTYNKWALNSNVIIENNELVEWAIKTLHEMMGLNPELLKEAIILQNK